MSARRLRLCLCLGSLLWAGRAHAQLAPGAAEQPPPAGPVLTPPKLAVYVDPTYPAQAYEEKLEAEVVLRLVVGSDGFVEQAELAGPPVGHGFDEAALEAGRRLLFEPATKDGAPVRARILYKFTFAWRPPPEAAQQQAAPTVGELGARLLDQRRGRPLVGAELLLTSQADPDLVVRAVSDAQGAVLLQNLPPGEYEVTVTADGFTPQTQRERVAAGERTELTYRLAPVDRYADDDFGAVARVRAPPREVTRRIIPREAMTRMPGTRGDALRTIELMPGVAQPPLGAGVVLIRGSAPFDSQVLLEGIPVPLLYHFGGLTSFYNSRALDRIEFYPGNFSPRFGRQTGGIIDVGVRDPKRDGYHAVIDTNLPLDSSLLVEGPLGERTSFIVGARRSYLGELASAAIPEGTFEAFPAPFYWDYQAMVLHRPSDQDKLRFMAYGVGDSVKVLFAEVPDNDPAIRGIEANVTFYTLQSGWERQYSKRASHKIDVAYLRIRQDFDAGQNVSFGLRINALSARAEWRYRLTRNAKLTLGTDTQLVGFDVEYVGPPLTQQEGGNGGPGGPPLSALPTVDDGDQRWDARPALYLENELRLAEPWTVNLGLRLDYFQGIDEWAFDPRLSTHYQLTARTRLKAGAGVFSQQPQEPEWSPAFGNPQLEVIRSLHYGAGFEHDFNDYIHLEVEGFYKHLYRRVVSTPFGEEPRFINDGRGRIYGMEVAGRWDPYRRFLGFLSYTLMRSERQDRDEPWRLFDFDQTHILTASGVYKLGKGWEAGGTLRLWSGNPKTPITGASWLDDSGVYLQGFGRKNSARNPFHHRLDVRVEKKWIYESWQLAFYVDVQNVYNSTNSDATIYSFNARQSDALRGLPIIPAVGLRGEL